MGPARTRAHPGKAALLPPPPGAFARRWPVSAHRLYLARRRPCVHGHEALGQTAYRASLRR
eukprot:2107413-Alexandrium_andersonii.AAC.1